MHRSLELQCMQRKVNMFHFIQGKHKIAHSSCGALGGITKPSCAWQMWKCCQGRFSKGRLSMGTSFALMICVFLFNSIDVFSKPHLYSASHLVGGIPGGMVMVVIVVVVVYKWW